MSTYWHSATVNAFSTTLNGTVGSGDTSMTLNSVTGLQAPGILVIDRQDGSGNNTATKREFISYTGISGSQVTGVIRARGGSTGQSHNSGALVEETMSIDHWEDGRSIFLTEHDLGGHHVISTATITTALYASGASGVISDLTVPRYLNIAGASLVGSFPITPVWIFAGGSSGPTTHPGVVSLPQGGNFQWVTALTRTIASAASVVFDILKNGTSIFAGVTTPTIVGGGTFVSTASLNVKTYAAGDVLIGQIKTLTPAGVITDVTLEIRGY